MCKVTVHVKPSRPIPPMAGTAIKEEVGKLHLVVVDALYSGSIKLRQDFSVVLTRNFNSMYEAETSKDALGEWLISHISWTMLNDFGYKIHEIKVS